MNNHSFESELNLRVNKSGRAPTLAFWQIQTKKQFYHENHAKQEKKDCTHCQIKGAWSKLSPISTSSLNKDFQLAPLCIIFHNFPHPSFSCLSLLYIHHSMILHTVNLKIRTFFTWIKSGVSEELKVYKTSSFQTNFQHSKENLSSALDLGAVHTYHDIFLHFNLLSTSTRCFRAPQNARFY